jgi:hypothetical protein
MLVAPMLALSPTCPGGSLQSNPQQTVSLNTRFVGDNTNKGGKEGGRKDEKGVTLSIGHPFCFYCAEIKVMK